jgi:ATP-binding cassette subfamily B protein
LDWSNKATTCGGFLSVVLCIDMAQLPNIIEKDRSLIKLFLWIVKASFKASKSLFLLQLVLLVLLAVIPFLSSYNFGQLLTILSKPGLSFEKVIIPLGFVVILNYLPSPISFIKDSFEAFNARNIKTYLEQKIMIKQGEVDIATIESPEFQNLLDQAKGRGQASIMNILQWFYSILRDLIKIFISLAIFLSVTKLGLFILILSILPVYFYEKWRSIRLAKIWTDTTESNRKARSKLELFSGKTSVLEVKFFNLIDFFKDKVLFIRNINNDLLTKEDKKTAIVRIIVDVLPSIGTFVVLYITIQKIIIGTIGIGMLSFILSTIWSFNTAFQVFLRAIGRLSEDRVHANKLMDLFELKPYVSENVNGESISLNTSYTLEFKNVSFTYPGSEREILSNISCTFKNGQEIAIVGLNGAGKTTLLRLITRVYDPSGGIILLNGKDLREYSLTEYRNILGVMMQDYHTYSDETIRDNIITNKDFDEKLFHEVTTQTGVVDYVKQYEAGFDQMIGTEFRGGVELSKGQKQKLALARVLYRNAPIIILDEPTAAIDALSEDTIFKSLRENHTDQTRIIISHKFSNVRDADTIILIEHGTIIEQGSHRELMNIDNGRYRELFDLQAEGYK